MKNAFTNNNNIFGSKYFRLIGIPLIIIFTFNFVLFICSTFYDLEIMDFFGKGLESRFLTLFSQFYHYYGYTELYIPFFVSLFILLEYFSRRLTNDSKKISKLRWWWFGFILIIWFILMAFKSIGNIKDTFNTHFEDGKVIDFDLGWFISGTDLKLILSLVFIVQLAFLVFTLLLLKVRILDKPYFIENKIWIKGVELIIFFFISYVVVGSLKIIMGRDYYRQMLYVIEYRAKILEEMIGNGSIVDIDYHFANNTHLSEFTPWWKPNGLIGNIDKISEIFKTDIGSIFTANAFPSGHMAATGLVGYMFYTFWFNPREHAEKIKKPGIVLFWLFNIQMSLMVLSFYINGSHWPSDLSFSWMWVIISIFLTQLVSNRIFKKLKT